MPMDIRTYLGNRVQQARKACKLTQQELSDQTGVSIKMIQGIESGSVKLYVKRMGGFFWITPLENFQRSRGWGYILCATMSMKT